MQNGNNKPEKLQKYPITPLFEVVDTIGVPHFYCITPKHLEHSPGMYLDIEEAEKHGAKCDICKKLVRKGKQDSILTYVEHETVLLIKIKSKAYPKVLEAPGLREFLLSIKEITEADKYAGFAFTR